MQGNRLIVEPSLHGALSAITHPYAVLDFETVQLAIPVWDGCRPYPPIDDDRYIDERTMARLKDKLEAAGVSFAEGPGYGGRLIILDLGDNPISVFCEESMAAMAATTALVTRLAEFPEFVPLLKTRRERHRIFQVIFAMLKGEENRVWPQTPEDERDQATRNELARLRSWKS